MNISSVKDMDALIELWKNESTYVQQRNIRLAVDTIELNMMYYGQKGNSAGVRRMENCLEALDRFRLITEKDQK